MLWCASVYATFYASNRYMERSDFTYTHTEALRIRTRRPYVYAHGGMETALGNSMSAIFFTHTYTDKRRHSFNFSRRVSVMSS